MCTLMRMKQLCKEIKYKIKTSTQITELQIKFTSEPTEKYVKFVRSNHTKWISENNLRRNSDDHHISGTNAEWKQKEGSSALFSN